MGTFLNNLPAPVSTQSRQFFTAWDGWRRGRRLPERRDIDLVTLGDLAAGHMLFDIRSRDDMTIAAAGPLITQIIGFDLTGYSYLDLTSRENRAYRAHLTIEQLLQPCGVLLYYWLRFPGDAFLPVEFSGAPLCENDAADPSLIFACASLLAPGAGRPGTPDPDSYLIADGMRFIDIGFGLPAANPAAPQKLQQLH